MEDIPNWIRALVPTLLLVSTVVFFVIKSHFVAKEDFQDFQEKYERERKDIEGRIIKQGKDIVEIKTDVKHMAKSLQSIEDFVVNPRKRRGKD